ncbi:MAG: exosortase E/protease, VPEID-CTERM system, partial [Gammaproteobacteria bacterium]
MLVHLLAFAAFAVITGCIFGEPVDPAHLSAPWFTAWFIFAGSTFLSWLWTQAPANFWLHTIRE